MPRNVSGVKCVKCGFSFESDRYDSRNKKRGVNGSKFWEKYVRYYQNVKGRIELKPTDILCNTCHHQIDRCKVPPEAKIINDLRLKPLEVDESDLEIVKVDNGREAPKMSLRISGNNLKRYMSEENSDVNTPANKRFVSPAVHDSQSGSDRFSQNNECVENILDDGDPGTFCDKFKSVDTTEVEIKNSCDQTNICRSEEMTSTQRSQTLSTEAFENPVTLPCISAHGCQIDNGTGLVGTIRELVNDGSFYNDELKFSIDSQSEKCIKINRQMLQLWLLRRTSKPYLRNIRQLDACSTSLFEQVMKFIHTGDTSSYVEFCEIIGDPVFILVDHFLLGLFIYQSLLKFSDEELKEIVEKLDKTLPSSVVKKIILFLTCDGSPSKTGLSDTFKFIDENFDVWNEFNVLEEDAYNFSAFQKYCFYYWVYCKNNIQPSDNILRHVLTSLRPTVTIEADECFEYVSLETKSLANVRLHSLILLLRQEVHYQKYLKHVNHMRSIMKTSTYSTDCIRLFIEIIYFGKDRFQKIDKPHLSSIIIDFAHLFFIKRPLKLFGCEDHPKSGLDARVFMELFVKTGSQKYLDCFLTNPRVYLQKDFTKWLHTRHMYTILTNDELQLKEVEVYELAIRFVEDVWCEDEEEQFKSVKGRLDKLLPAVRFGIMTDDEFKVVRNQSYLTLDERNAFFYLIHYPGEPLTSNLKRFHKATTKRRFVCEEAEAHVNNLM